MRFISEPLSYPKSYKENGTCELVLMHTTMGKGPYLHETLHKWSSCIPWRKDNCLDHTDIWMICYFRHLVLQPSFNRALRVKQSFLLGSKDLGSKCFRTSMCNVGKPWSKLKSLDLGYSKYVNCKVEIEWLQKITVHFLQGSINRKLDSIDRSSCRLFFYKNLQLKPKSMP